MKYFLVVIFAVIGTVYSRSLPVKTPYISVDVDALSGNPIYLIRKVRQSGKWKRIFVYQVSYCKVVSILGGGGGYNDFDYNPYNDSPRNYDGNPFNDVTHRQLYNNFDQNPYNDSPNKYDDNYFRLRYNL